MILGPDSFRNNPYGFLTNQAGHAYLVGFPLAWVGLFMFSHVYVLVFIGAAYFLVWEVVVQRFAEPLDSIIDTAHVTIGAAVAITMWGCTDWGVWPYLYQATLLLIGVLKRTGYGVG